MTAAQIVVSDYPELDRPVANAADDPNVKLWMSQIDMDGIPDWQPNGDGGCQNTTYNKDAIADAGADGRCWWTCGGSFPFISALSKTRPVNRVDAHSLNRLRAGHRHHLLP